METNLTSNTFNLQVDNGNISYLNETAKWAKFLSIMGFIFSGLMLVVGLLASTVLSSVFKDMEASAAGNNFFALGGGFIAAIYIVFALVLFFPSLFQLRFAAKMQTALRTDDQISLNTSFKNLNSYFKFWGIVMIIILCFYALVIIFSVLGAAFIR